MNPRQYKVQCISPAGLHRMAYLEWGDPDNSKILVCVHGLTRVSQDFDDLAHAMMDEYRVICPDVVGRGASDWLRDPAYYTLPQYVADMVTLLACVNAHAAHMNAPTVHWLGTSMGGLIGMALACLPDTPVQKLILNDVGPVLDGAALGRIAEYVGLDLHLPNLAAAEQFIRSVCAPFGVHSDAQWRHLTENVFREKDGQWSLHYDPAISINMKNDARTHPDTMEFWWGYDPITCPVLAVRGELSDLLSRQTHQQMGQRGPRAQLVEISGVGHAPTFMHTDQIKIARDFLLA